MTSAALQISGAVLLVGLAPATPARAFDLGALVQGFRVARRAGRAVGACSAICRGRRTRPGRRRGARTIARLSVRTRPWE